MDESYFPCAVKVIFRSTFYKNKRGGGYQKSFFDNLSLIPKQGSEGMFRLSNLPK